MAGNPLKPECVRRSRLLAVALLGGALVCAFTPPALADPVRVEFRFQHTTAYEVNLAGSFNGWCSPSGGWINVSIDPMNGPDPAGWWTLEKLLDPGYHEYKFVADGHVWYTDPMNPRVNHQSNDNSILEVSDPLVYYLLPKDGTTVYQPLPEISAYLAKSDGASFDLNTLSVFLDDELAAAGPWYYNVSTGQVVYTPVDSLANGGHEAKISVALVGGSSHADSSGFSVIVDMVPPEITHVPPAAATANAPVHVECTIQDNMEVTAAELHYRNAGDTTFVETPFSEGLGDTWVATVPAGFAQEGTDIEYFIAAHDHSNTAYSPPTGVHSVPVLADDVPPTITEAFASPPTINPDGEDDESRLSFYLSEPCTVTVAVTTDGGSHRRTLIDEEKLAAGYHYAIWDGRTDAGILVADADYYFHVNAVDGAGLQADEGVVLVVVDRGSEPGPINVILLFHANQSLNYQGDTANDVCFWGLLDVLRRHPQSKFMLHFSGTLLHDIGWYNFRHDPSTLDLLRAGASDGQFEIVGSTYAQNVPYSTHMWDNERQVEVQREVIETMVGADPVSFWNAERCWKQGLVPLVTTNGYSSTWVESHILWDSGTAASEFIVRKTAHGEDEVIVFNDDSELIGALDWAIDTGYTGDVIGYLDWLRSQDTYRDWVICYCQDAEATGLWDYEAGSDPQEDWDNLDTILTEMEATGWIKLTTMSEYLEARHPTEELTPIVDGQANWMVGPSQAAGYADWFDYNENSPLLAFYRDFYDGIRDRIREVEAQVSPGTPEAKLVKHAIWNLVAHQFEFGCIGCGTLGCQDWQKAETLEGALLAAEAAMSPPDGTEISQIDANGDGLLDWVITTKTGFHIISDTGGRLLRWFDLGSGEEILGNEFFMWGLYYWGWRDWYTWSGHNNDVHYQVDAVWDAPYQIPAAAPFHRIYKVRKHAMNDWLSVDGGDSTIIIDAEYNATVVGDTLRQTHSGPGFGVTKSWIGGDTSLTVDYEVSNTSGQAHQYRLRIENELSPSLLEVMNGGRGTLAYWDGSDTSAVIGPGSVGVVNVVTDRAVRFDFSEAPTAIRGGETVHGLSFDPVLEFELAPAQTKTIRITMGVTPTYVEPGDDPPPGGWPFRLDQNHPNPFNPVTTVGFSLPHEGTTELAIYNTAGKRVATLVRDLLEAGPHGVTWNGTDRDGHAVASGVYFLRLTHGGRSIERKGVLLR